MPDTQTDWHAAGCARDCSVQHTYQPGRCALSTEQPPEPTISIGRVETMADGQPGIVLRSIPASVWDGLIAVAAHVSTGRGFAFVGQGPYPDAKARRILGALHDAGLLPQPEEPADQPAPAATQATDERCCVCGGSPVTYHNYRDQPFCWPCADCQCNQDVCVRTGINDPAVSAQPEPATVTDPEWLRHQYRQALAQFIDPDDDTMPTLADDGHGFTWVTTDSVLDKLMNVRDGYVAQLIQRLELADQAHRQEQQRADRLAADLTGWRNLAAEHQQATIAALERADRLAATLREALDCIILGNGAPRDPDDLTRWRAVLDQPKEN